ncbi:MalY/PatB family protein [Anaerorudis cellulosivorans]|uniref:MalY/PatB family protein n=1 Tax=Anaerorudis cellulosivorans TaxID=3397862 RepID=UPI00221F9913|nr:MalY/PatB family protein [Seramator thermalis]MCW1735171.1 pyridoxal phosphate-dependent aminotransferase [Seramator thermalis]
MKYNFDEVIDRRNTSCVKFDAVSERLGRNDFIPLWVADMDFLSPPCVIEALKKRVEHGIFGYTFPSPEYYRSIIDWLKKRHHLTVKKEYLTFVPGIVKGIAFAIDEFTEKGDKVIIQPPVYHPFRIVTEGLERQVVNNPLALENGRYRMDIDGLKKAVAENDCKVLILCNPHNPGGRIWSSEELAIIAEICYDKDILVISDEIHADLALPGYHHTPFVSVSEKAAQNSITFMAPSKTFNIAGIVSSFAVIPNIDIRKRYVGYLEKRELNQGDLFAYTAAQAAYEGGEEWLDELLKYIKGNIDFVSDFLATHIPQIKPMVPEASFLVWLDCRGLELSQKELVSLFRDKAHLVLNDGTMFGKEGEGFMRMNVGSPRAIIEKALINLKNAVNE